MKTITDIQNEIKAIEELQDKPSTEVKPSKKKRELKRIPQLRQIIRYLEVPCKEEHLGKQLETLRNSVFKIVDGFDTWKKCNPDEVAACGELSKMKAKYHKQMGLKKIKDQIKALEYILN